MNVETAMDPFDFDNSVPPNPPPSPARSRSRIWIAVGSVALLAGAFAAVYLAIRRPEKAPAPVTADGTFNVVSQPVRPSKPSLVVTPSTAEKAAEPQPPAGESPRFVETRKAFEAILMRMPDQMPVADFKDLSWMPSPFVEPKRDGKTGFVVGGKNNTALIHSLTELNGRPLAELEADLLPESPNLTPHRSYSGFLMTDQRLLDVLAADNDYVVGTLGLTHQELGRPLKAMVAAGRWLQTHRPDGWPRPDDEWYASYKRMRQGDGPAFVYRGRRFRVVWTVYKGDQESPFLDGTLTSKDVTLVNLESKKMLRYSLLVPEMIERYGFYEGPGTPYRVEPKDIVEVLDFLRPAPR